MSVRARRRARRCCCGCTFEDDFSTVKAGYTNASTAGTPNFTVSGGKLFCEAAHTINDDGSRTQAMPRPALNGLVVSVEADVHQNNVYFPTGASHANYTTVGVVVGKQLSNLFVFLAWRPHLSDCILTIFNSPSSVTVGVPGSSASRLKLEVVDVSSGGGTYDLRCHRDGSLVHTQSGVALTLPNPLPMGVACSDGGQWDNLCIETNA